MQINSQRLWQSLMEIAKIGATSKGGCNRQALTEFDIEGRALFTSWCHEIALELSFDAVGNMFARLNGTDGELPPLVLGSHLDTQPTGGKYDGVLGVLAGLEVLRCLRENDIVPQRSVEIACWMNEEGARFVPAMMGSSVYAGALDLNEVREIRDADGISVGSELDKNGYSSCPNPIEKEINAYLELHIEQGPILEETNTDIGVVTGAQGIRWYDVIITGEEIHAGPSPMAMRHDPMELVPELVAGVYGIGKSNPNARATIGQFQVFPSSRNVVPGRVEISVDLRYPVEAELLQMHNKLSALVENLGSSRPDLGIELKQVWHLPVIEFDPDLVAAIRDGATDLNLSNIDIISGAGHDALMVARKAPTAMIFIPCRGGISHNEAEHIEPVQAAAGGNVLLQATLRHLGVG